jgi:hypothetical protein
VSGPAIADTNWHFVVFWHNAAANTIQIQIDNAAPVSAGTTGPMPAGLGAVTIGLGWGLNFDGLIDEIGLWRRVLTADERTQLYNGGNGLTYPFGLAELLRSRG